MMRESKRILARTLSAFFHLVGLMLTGGGRVMLHSLPLSDTIMAFTLPKQP